MAYKKGMVTAKEIKGIIDKGKLKYLILLGQRSNGKSYATKHMMVERAYKNNEMFIYLRRRKEDISDYLTEAYFNDLDVAGITDGVYSMVSIYRKGIYLANVDENGVVTRGVLIGYVRALALAERYKSGAYSRVKYIVFEEFVTENTYLQGEVDKLDNFVSTVLRMENGCIILIGNTISRVCPYYREYGLTNIRKQKQGTVDLYKKKGKDENGDEIEINVGVYLTGTVDGVSGMFFRKSAGMINRGEWFTNDYPHLNGNINDYSILHTVVYIMGDNSFLCRLISYNNALGCVWYVTPKTTEIKDNTRVVSRHMIDGVIWSKDFKSPVTKEEATAFDLLLRGYVVFADNLTGTEFYQCLKNDGLGVRSL